MISIGEIYDKDVNFVFGSGASYGLLPTLQLGIKADDGGGKCTLEELATKFERENDPRLIPLFMHYYASCIRPAERLGLKEAEAGEPGKTVVANYRAFMLTVLEMVKRRRALDRRCNIFTTNYDGCFPLVADSLIAEGGIDFVLNDGTRGFTQRVVQARNFGAYLCQSGVFGRYQSSIPQINLIHLHGSVYWSKRGETILVDYDLSSRASLLDENTNALLKPFSDTLNNEAATIVDLKMPAIDQAIMDGFWKSYQLIPIVNPTKWKFYETVYEEHYYQMLRLLSYELEKSNAVLITFGFSFADEHILNLVTRSLSNPGLQVFVCCFDNAELVKMQQRFQSYRNVKCLALEGAMMDFSAFNSQVLAWPEATAPTKKMDDDVGGHQVAVAPGDTEAGVHA